MNQTDKLTRTTGEREGRRGGGEADGGGDGRQKGEKMEDEGRVTHVSDSRAGIVAAATPTAAASPSLMSVPPHPLSLHE